jgi:AmiR/NasT family two-component response regulator
LIAENEQLRHAIDTRDTIGQAKGMLMERFDIDAVGAFDLLVRLSQNTNTRVEQIARKLIEIDHPPCSS